jgi:murein L,D-transpeptidase YafK
VADRSYKIYSCRRALVSLAAAVLVLPPLVGCVQQRPAPPPTPQSAHRVVEPSPLSQLPTDGLALVVYKRARTLAVYEDGRFRKRYAVVLGKRPQGSKRFAGDMRTPEGLYWIKDKHPHARWRYFITIDYPNELDQARYERELSAGLIPNINGIQQGIGGSLGIHGNDRPGEQSAGSNWTKGCVAMMNDDVRELYTMVRVGTPVLFLP